jgi:hypothetical protein
MPSRSSIRPRPPILCLVYGSEKSCSFWISFKPSPVQPNLVFLSAHSIPQLPSFHDSRHHPDSWATGKRERERGCAYRIGRWRSPEWRPRHPRRLRPALRRRSQCPAVRADRDLRYAATRVSLRRRASQAVSLLHRDSTRAALPCRPAASPAPLAPSAFRLSVGINEERCISSSFVFHSFFS